MIRPPFNRILRPCDTAIHLIGASFIKHNLVEVVAVEPGGPSAKAGVRAGNLVIAVNEQKVTTIDDIQRSLSKWAVGQRISIVVFRDGRTLDITITPGEARAA